MRNVYLPNINMELILFGFFLVAAMLSPQITADSRSQNQISISMPDIRPDHAEQYLCVAHRIPISLKGQFIVGFNPKSNSKRVHHMLLHGCSKPGLMERDTPNLVWDCGEMQSSKNDNHQTSYERAPICDGSDRILYGWALDAPALIMPEGVGFAVGGLETNIHFLILQVHYGHYHAFQQSPALTDNSGLILDLKPNDASSGITRRAGVLLLFSIGQVLQGKTQHEIWCPIHDDIVIHPFRYRVHTHKLGTRVMGAKFVGKSKVKSEIKPNFEDKFDRIIGSGDPQKPQTFYPVEDKDISIRKGDTVYARCEFMNNKTRPVKIGATGDDEMCNFYLMYWTDGPDLLSRGDCYNEINMPMSSLFSNLFQ